MTPNWCLLHQSTQVVLLLDDCQRQVFTANKLSAVPKCCVLQAESFCRVCAPPTWVSKAKSHIKQSVCFPDVLVLCQCACVLQAKPSCRVCAPPSWVSKATSHSNQTICCLSVLVACRQNPAVEYVLDYLLERKSVEDLMGSIKNQRFDTQKYGMRRCGLRHLLYLVEGDPNNLQDSCTPCCC